MEHVETQTDMFEESCETDQKKSGIRPLRRIITVADMTYVHPAPFRVVRLSPTQTLILNDGVWEGEMPSLKAAPKPKDDGWF